MSSFRHWQIETGLTKIILKKMEQTLGQKRVNVKIDERSDIYITRKSIADIIDHLEHLRGETKANSESQRLISIAQTKLEEACMFTVKAIYNLD